MPRSTFESSIDTRFMRAVCVLLYECNVTRASERLGCSQPAASSTLRRARELLGDPLLVRGAHGLLRTERGEEVLKSFGQILDALHDALAPRTEFDPAEATGRVRIAAINCFGGFLIPALSGRLRREAPELLVEFHAPNDRVDFSSELGAGLLDLVIGNWPVQHDSLRSSSLLHCDIACVVSSRHPHASRAALEMHDYLRLPHVSPTPRSSAAYSPIDGRLRQLGLRRRIALAVPEYALLPSVLVGSDLALTTARPFAEHVIAQAGPGRLRLIEAPKELEQMDLYLLWHERSQSSALSAWLRDLVREVARGFDRRFRAREGPPTGTTAMAAL